MLEAIRVLVVEDNKIVSKKICDILNSDKRIKVVAISLHGADAYEKILTHKPDLMTLDINMPIMGGIELLELLIEKNICIRTLVISASTFPNSDIAVKCRSLGVLDIISKPYSGNIFEIKNEIIDKVTFLGREFLIHTDNTNHHDKVISKDNSLNIYESKINENSIKHALNLVRNQYFSMPRVIVIGVSTGGPVALRVILSMLPKHFEIPILIVQHIPHEFSSSLAVSLQSVSDIIIKEAKINEKLEPGTVYISPGDRNMGVYKDERGVLHIDIIKNNGAYDYTPSVDYLFESVAHTLNNSAIAIIMTGMGSDGINGLKKLYDNNTLTIAQDKDTSTVFGMPRLAIEKKISVLTLSLYDIAEFLKRYIHWRSLL